jgi:phosphate transport system permease protein
VESPLTSTAATRKVGSTVRLGRPRLRRAPRWHALAEGAVFVVAMSAIVSVALILIFVAREALPLMTDAAVRHVVTPWRMFTAQHYPGYDHAVHVWQPVSSHPKYGMVPLFVGTLKTTAVSLLFAVPLAILAAIWVSQYAPRRLGEPLKAAIEVFAGIPSVVLGFLALIVLASALEAVFGFTNRLNAIVAGIALGFTVLPLVFTLAEDALRAVPRSYVEASTALGARKWQTIVRVVLPAATPGISAGVILGLGRAVGETMIVLMASGNAAQISWDFGQSVRTMTATIAAEMAEVVFPAPGSPSPHYSVLFFIGVVLFAFTFAINTVGAWGIERLGRKLGGAARGSGLARERRRT